MRFRLLHKRIGKFTTLALAVDHSFVEVEKEVELERNVMTKVFS